jgi:hypothetical protein
MYVVVLQIPPWCGTYSVSLSFDRVQCQGLGGTYRSTSEEGAVPGVVRSSVELRDKATSQGGRLHVPRALSMFRNV